MNKALESIRLGLVATIMLTLVFLFAEPALVRGVSAEDQHTVKQTITSEISFLVAAVDVTMNNSIGGVTGGTSYGTATVAVLTNDTSGFTMTIKASSSPAMQGENLSTDISDYTPAAAGVPDFDFSAPGSGAELGYSFSASTTASLAQKFKDDGAACNTGSSDTGAAGSCWYGLSTVATSTMVTSAPTLASGATSSVYYRVYVAASSGLDEGVYNATTTLTATTN